MRKSNPMSPTAASRIQRATAKSSSTGGVSKNSFAARAQSIAVKNTNK